MKKLVIAALALIAVAVLIVLLWFFAVLRNLPDVSALKHYRPAAATEVLDKDGNVITHYYDRKFRVWAPMSALPDIVIHAVVIAEDDTFFEHEGVNYKAVWEALQQDVRKKRFARGGSTITQQMIKNVLLSKEKTITRKIREFVLARKAEEILSKRRILEIYLNEVEWGDNIYGIEAASRFYFDKHASELKPGEAALLAGMLPNPRYYNPFKRMDKARHRQEQVLFNMHQAKILTDEEYQTALDAPVELRREGSGKFDFTALADKNGRACYQKVLEQILISLYGEHELFRKGLRIRTTLDKLLQNSMNAQLDSKNEHSHDIPSSVTIVKEGREIRAILCSSDEDTVRNFLSGYTVLINPYEAATTMVDDVAAESIIQPEITTAPVGTTP
jgi:membrane peptidoglycan carboxypeptidase